MAKQKSSFDLKHIEETAAVQTSGVLDQLNLPPALIDFLRKNQRRIWITAAVIAAVVTVVALYGSYRNYTMRKASEAYDQALILPDEQKKEALDKIVATYGSTPLAIWSRVELARMDQAAGATKHALQQLTAINSELKPSSLLKPLVLVNLGALYEQVGEPAQALEAYQQLKTLQGFEAEALSSLGRVYESQGNKEQAIAMFQEYLQLTSNESTAPRQDDPAQVMIRATLNRLQQ